MARARGWWDGRFADPIDNPARPYMTAPSSCRDTSSEPNWGSARAGPPFIFIQTLPNLNQLLNYLSGRVPRLYMVPKPATNLYPFSRRVSRTHMVTLDNGNCFKSDAPEWFFNWHAEIKFLFLMTSWHLAASFSAFAFTATQVVWLRLVRVKSLFDGLDCEDLIFTSILLGLLHWLPCIWQGTCFLTNITSSVMCLIDTWIDLKNVWEVWSLLVKNQEVNPRTQAQLEEGHAMGWWLIEVWWRATLCQFEKCCSWWEWWFELYSDCILYRFAHVLGLIVDSPGADAFCINVAVRQATWRTSRYDFNAGVAFGAFVCAVAATTFTAMLLILSEASSATC